MAITKEVIDRIKTEKPGSGAATVIKGLQHRPAFRKKQLIFKQDGEIRDRTTLLWPNSESGGHSRLRHDTVNNGTLPHSCNHKCFDASFSPIFLCNRLQKQGCLMNGNILQPGVGMKDRQQAFALLLTAGTGDLTGSK